MSLLASVSILVVSTFVASSALGQSESEAAEVDYINNGRNLGAVSRTLSIGIGVGLERFDTNVKFTEKSTGDTRFIDLEGTLGMPETDVVPILYGYWRINDKRGIGFSYYQIRRETTLLDIDKSLITGKIEMSDESRFYSLSYNHSLYHDDRAYVFLALGVNAIDLKYRLDAEGTLISLLGIKSREVNQIAPLPMIGIDAWFALTPRWAFGTKLALIGGSYKRSYS